MSVINKIKLDGIPEDVVPYLQLLITRYYEVNY
jgi:hypothetical protein